MVLRGETVPQRLPPGGLLVLRDGETVEETAILSPLAWAIEHRAEVEVTVGGATPAARTGYSPRCRSASCSSPVLAQAS